MKRALVLRASARHLLRHPWQFGLAVLGIALGVALAVGIDVAGASVRRAFRLSTAAVSGGATHEIVGGPRGVPEALYRELRVDRGLREIAPFVGGVVGLPEHSGEVLEIAGIDLFAEAPLRPRWGWNASPAVRSALPTLLTRPGAAMISAGTARRLGVRQGDTLAVQVGAERKTLELVFIVETTAEANEQLAEGVVLVDIATAQEVLGRVGWLTRIDVMTGSPAPAPSGDAKLIERIAGALPPAARIQPVATRTEALLAMTRAFDLNLRALSLLALVVGGFLVYNTVTFSVVQRRSIIATLRTLGTTRAEIFGVILAEAAVIGLLGVLVGVPLGIGLSRGLVHLVSRAVTDLYFVVSVREMATPILTLARGASFGIAAAVVSALPAAREATREEPTVVLFRSSLEQRARAGIPRLAAAGALVLLLAFGLLASSERSLAVAFVAILFIVLGAALVAPAGTVFLIRIMGPALQKVLKLSGRMAARSVVASLSRTGVAVASLMVALSVTVGVSLMVASFRHAVEAWLDDTLRADLYVSAAPLVAARNEAPLPRDLPERLAAVRGVVGMSTARAVTLATPTGPTFLLALELAPGRQSRLPFLQGARDQAWKAFAADEGLLVSESLAFKRKIAVGDSLMLPTRTGTRRFPVVGVVRDYGSDAGTVMMSRRTYDRHFDDPFVSSIGLFVGPDVKMDGVIASVRATARPDERLFVRSRQAVRTATLEVFDRTFEVTEVLRLLALIVAAFGVTSALMALELERTRELGVLRALGFTKGQVATFLGVETSLLGLVAGLLAVPLGLALAAVLVFVINRRSFGWTMDLVVANPALALAPLLGLVAGLLAGIYPTLALARTSPAEALRNE